MRSSGGGEPVDFLRLWGVRTISVDERVKRGVGILYVTAEADHDEPPFHWCSHPDLVGNGRRDVEIADYPHGHLPVRILYRRRRWKCRSCGEKGIYEETPHAAHGHMMTDRLLRYIARNAPELTFAKIGRMVGLSEGTMRNVFKSVMKAHKRLPVQAPLVLGLDEKHIKRRHVWGVVGDVDRRRILDVLPDRGPAMQAFLRGMTNRDRTRVVTMDMWRAYRTVAKRLFPNAVVVVDRFHVVMRADDALSAYRNHLAEAEEKGQGIRRSKLRAIKGILRVRLHKADARTLARLNLIFDRWPALREAYEVKEDFCNIYSSTYSPKEAEMAFGIWRDTLPLRLEPWFKGVVPTDEWMPFVLNYFDWPYTNGCIEGLNSIIGEKWRVGRGYSLDVLRYKMLLDPDNFPSPGPDKDLPSFRALQTLALALGGNDNLPSPPIPAVAHCNDGAPLIRAA